MSKVSKWRLLSLCRYKVLSKVTTLSCSCTSKTPSYSQKKSLYRKAVNKIVCFRVISAVSIRVGADLLRRPRAVR
jgi:hypothetical protein